MRHQHGFTLIELSIVLVIIGLLIGGILSGRMLIENAEIRKTASTFSAIELATKTFRQKYNCIPGDCAKAEQLALGDSGNGDGIYTLEDSDYASVPYLFVRHLSSSGLARTMVDSGINAIGGTHMNGGTFVETAQELSANNIQVGSGYMVLTFLGMEDPETEEKATILTPLQAKRIDETMDNGLPYTGKLVSMNATLGPVTDLTEVNPLRRAPGINAGATNDGFTCVTNDTSPPVYNNLSITTKRCGVALDLNAIAH